jgi:RimJ/RimL family protein N-acetyltransferase
MHHGVSMEAHDAALTCGWTQQQIGNGHKSNVAGVQHITLSALVYRAALNPRGTSPEILHTFLPPTMMDRFYKRPPRSDKPSSCHADCTWSSTQPPKDPPSHAAKPPSWPASWPTNGVSLETAALRLLPLQPSHASPLAAPVLDLPWNQRMFPLVYGDQYQGSIHLAELFATHLHDPSVYGGAYAILDRTLEQIIGWMVIKPFDDSGEPVSCIIFLEQSERTQRGSETMFIICRHVFETLNHSVIDWRTGKLTEDAGHYTNSLGFQIIAVLRRQMLVEERSKHSDLHVLRKEDWQGVKEAFGAWLEQAAAPGLNDSGG